MVFTCMPPPLNQNIVCIVEKMISQRFLCQNDQRAFLIDLCIECVLYTSQLLLSVSTESKDLGRNKLNGKIPLKGLLHESNILLHNIKCTIIATAVTSKVIFLV